MIRRCTLCERPFEPGDVSMEVKRLGSDRRVHMSCWSAIEADRPQPPEFWEAFDAALREREAEIEANRR